MAKQITKEMTIADVFSTFPEKSQKLAQVMQNAGLACSSCNAATYETLEAGVLGHGFDQSALENLLVKLNEVLQEESDSASISLSPKAASKFLEIAEEEKKLGFGLRFGLIAGGCSGHEYLLDFAQEPEDNDEVFESEGIKIFVSKQQLPKLLGSQIDYVEGLHKTGFSISNPNTKHSCACGSSQGF